MVGSRLCEWWDALNATPVDSSRSRNRVAILGFSLLGGCGFLAILLVTPHGAGVSSDSVYYLEGARNLAAGKGYSSDVTGVATPVTHWPPFYSVTLAAVAISGIDPWIVARWLNASLMAANIFLTGYCVLKQSHGSLLATALAAILTVASPGLLWVHSMVWSEPLFIVLILSALMCLINYITSNRISALIGSACALSLALVTRYFALPIVAAAVIGIVLLPHAAWPRRIRDALVFTALAFFPFCCFLVRNLLHAGQATDWVGFAEFQVSSVSLLSWVQTTLAPVLQWCDSGTLSFWPRRGTQAAGCIGICGAAVILLHSVTVPHRQRRVYWQTLTCPLLAVATYCAFFALSACYVGLDMRFAVLRYSVPLQPIIIVIAVTVTDRYIRHPLTRPKGIVVAALSYATVAAASVVASYAWVINTRSDGQEYASSKWRTSPTLEFVKNITPEADVFSDGWDVVLHYTRRRAQPLPMFWDKFKERPAIHYRRDVDALRKQLEVSDGFVVYLNELKRQRYYIVRPEELSKDLRLDLVLKTDDGLVYHLRR